eukprot:CAMPEP_0202374872 /NCGR_PEP_ID=MMETSP1127-20130417/5619_1 /ASSEMBLY_ACC=CAM_ASM_000462 /TAXON_ID=3047 /ORGANISM="Dunaliella tertiolecta, Strain CCMP1320" /LENGTH=919 /DNA_ID=CAMNT_0048972149 /DNA_START=2277 /DNA_END=5037 /DNA_ORIENTATION=-
MAGQASETDCSELCAHAKALLKPPSFHISVSGRLYRGVEQGTDRHVLLVELQEARQIRASLIQHLLKQSGRTETLASDRDSARVASWLSSLNSPVEHLWKHPVTAPLRACWFLGVLAITCNMCAAATLCYNWGLPAACCQSRGGAQLEARAAAQLADHSFWLADLVVQTLELWEKVALDTWLETKAAAMHWLLHHHLLREEQPEQDGLVALKQLHFAGLTPQPYNSVLERAQHFPAPKAGLVSQQRQNQQLTQHQLEQLLPDPQALLGGEPKRYEGVASVTIPDEAAYKALIKDLNRQQKAKNDKEKKARKQAASIAAAKEQLALACALVAPRSCSAVTAGNAATPASSSAAGPPGVPCTEALQGAMTAPSIETAAAGHGGSKKQAGDGPSRDRAAAAPAALAAGLGGSETLSLGLDLTRKDQAVLLSIDLEWYERSSELLLEIGWTLWDSASRRCSSKHWIVREGLGYANGRYVPNMRHAFKFGTSQVGLLADGIGSLQADIDAHPGLILVGHDVSQDMQMLAKWGILLPQGTQILDTSKLAWARIGDPSRQAMSLRTLLAWLQVPDVSGLHNGGNDARFTMEALLQLCAPEAAVGEQAPTASAVQAPTAPTAQAPTAPTVQAPTASVVQAPTAPTIQAPSAPTVQALSASAVQAPTASPTQAPEDKISARHPPRNEAVPAKILKAGWQQTCSASDTIPCGQLTQSSLQQQGFNAEEQSHRPEKCTSRETGGVTEVHAFSELQQQKQPQEHMLPAAQQQLQQQRLRQGQQQRRKQQQQEQHLRQGQQQQKLQQGDMQDLQLPETVHHRHPVLMKPVSSPCNLASQQQQQVSGLQRQQQQQVSGLQRQATHHLIDLQKQNPRHLDTQLSFRCIPTSQEQPSFYLHPPTEGEGEEEVEEERRPGDSKLHRQSAFSCHAPS